MAKDTKKNKLKKEKKAFFKDFKVELKKVTWPTPKQLATKTFAVIIIVVFIAAIVFALDFAFDKSYEFLITKASHSINKDNKNETSNDNEQNVIVEDVGEETENTDLTVDANTTDVVPETTSVVPETTAE